MGVLTVLRPVGRLYILDIADEPIAQWPAESSLSETASSTPELTSSSSSDILQQDQGRSLPSTTSDLRQLTAHSNIPIDSDGWQVAEGSDGKASLLIQEEATWQTAQSKRSKRKQRKRPNGTRSEYTGPDYENSAEPSSSSTIFGSVVDLENERERGHLNGSAQNGLEGQPSGSHTPSGFFSDLVVEEPMSNGRAKKGKKAAEGDDAEDRHKQPSALTSVPSEVHEDKLSASYSEHLAAHREERQVKLDILRSFVGIGYDPRVREIRRQQLQDVILGVLRRYPALNYYQGYHDVVCVLLLTLSPNDPPATANSAWASRSDFELVLEATSRFTLHYLRDFMAPKMDPCLGWLKSLRNVVREEDDDLARNVIERTSNMPYFALSWTITCLAHELPLGGQEIQAIFDFVMLSGPRAILHILAALVLTQGKQGLAEIEGSEDEDDPAMLHHSLSKLPTALVTGSDAGTRLREVLTKAQDLQSTRPEVASPDTIMGSSSVLNTWSAALPSTAATKGSWEELNHRAESYLSDPTLLAQVVLDPYPSPPPSEPDLTDDKSPSDRHGGKKRRTTVANTGTALFVSVLFIAGMAVLIGPAGLSTQGSGTPAADRSRIVREVAQLGKGLAGMALCAAGVC